MSRSKKIYSDQAFDNKMKVVLAEEPRKSKDLDIWNNNPSFIDINELYAYIRGLSVLIVAVFFSIALYLLSLNHILGVLGGVLTVIFFVIAFSDTIFSLKGGFFTLFSRYRKLDMFDRFTFFFTKDQENVLYISNKEQLKTVALSIFKVESLPETTKATLNQYIKVLNKHAMPYTFQIHQQPLISGTGLGGFKDYLSEEREGTMKSFQTAIYFATYYDVSGILTARKLHTLQEIFGRFVDSMRADFVGDFHHYKVQLLSGNQLIHALRSFVIRDIPYTVPKQMEVIKPNISVPSYIMKVGFCAFVLLATSLFLLSFNISYWIIMLIDLSLLVLMLWVWWRAPLYYLTANYLLKNE